MVQLLLNKTTPPFQLLPMPKVDHLVTPRVTIRYLKKDRKVDTTKPSPVKMKVD